jgi:hypothetical protein
MACNKLIISVTTSDITAADNGFVYFSFKDCQGQIITFAYDGSQPYQQDATYTMFQYVTGYNYDTAFAVDIYYYVSGVKTAASSAITPGVAAGKISAPYQTAPLLVPPAYGKKYTLQAIGKSGYTFTAEIWEKGYSGSSYQIGTGAEPFVMNCNASGDDQYQPILPTTFTIQADFTEFTGPLPDFTTTDDRKYHVKFYAQGTTYFIWQGFVLFDTLTLPFTTGRNYTTINCIDGLAMLKSIPYLPSTGDLNKLESVMKIINNCLMNIYLPDGYTFNSAVNYYQAVAMSESTSTIRQVYLAPAISGKNQTTYISCYEVLEKICESFGAQLYQSNGQWWFTSVNEKASDSIRVFTTDWKLVTDTISTKNIKYDIKPYINDTVTPFYFIQNGQVKILKKGYSQIEMTGDIKFPENTIDNGDLSRLTVSGKPYNWTEFLGVGGQYDRVVADGYICQRIVSGASASSTLVADSCGKVLQNEEIDLTLIYGSSYTTLNDLLRIKIYINVGGGNFWTYRKNNDEPYWEYNTTGFYGEPQNSDRVRTLNIKTTAAPVSGTLEIEFEVTSTAVVALYLASIFRKSTFPVSQRVIFNETAPTPYKKSVNVLIGAPDPFNAAGQSQSIYTDISYTVLTDVYRYGASSTLYANLVNLLFSQYFNCISQPQINLEYSQYNLFNGTDFIGLINTMAIQDPSSSLSVNANRYIFGALQFNFVSNTVDATALQVRNAVLSYTLVDPADPAFNPPTCKRYTNSSGGNWTGTYQNCAGSYVGPVTLTPSQYICARFGTPNTISGSNLTVGIDCS